MDFEDWEMSNPPVMSELCAVISTERRKAWNAALHAMGDTPSIIALGDRTPNVQLIPDPKVKQLQDRCLELHKEKCKLSGRVKELGEDKAQLARQVVDLKERLNQ